jgi:GT2 family glycosyltransferase
VTIRYGNVSIDLVVVNYHTPQDLDAFMASLNRFPPSGDATLTIVDVESTCLEPAEIEWAKGSARRIAVADNVGYARACNLAARGGTGTVVALFNADVEVTPHALDMCAAALMSSDDWGVLGPCQIDLRNRIRHAGIFGTNAAPVHRGWNEIHRGQYLDVSDAVTVSGSAYFVKRTVWEELANCSLYREVAPDAAGAFLPTPHYYEETWASYHCREHGYRVIYYGPITMVHKWHQASPVGGWAEQQMPASRELFRRACVHHGIACD